jgi:hypothetical protein
VAREALTLTLPQIALYPLLGIRERVAGLQDHLKIGVEEVVDLNVFSPATI